MVASYVTRITYKSWPKDNLRPKDSQLPIQFDNTLLKSYISSLNRAIVRPGGQLIACPSVYFDEEVPPSLHPFLAVADLVLRHSFVLWRHWRTMAFLASRSAGICKTDGLLARAGELCGIIRASYLSPFFPLVLGFELWRYLRQQLQIGDRSVQTRHNRLRLRLLRRAAFGLTLMLPAKGWAQGTGYRRVLKHRP